MLLGPGVSPVLDYLEDPSEGLARAMGGNGRGVLSSVCKLALTGGFK